MASVEARAEVRYVTAPDLAAGLAGADALFVWDFTSTAVEQAWHGADRLSWIHIASAGVDNLLFPELASSEVLVTNSRGVFERPMAEYVLGLVLAFAKQFPLTLELQRRQEWRHRETERIDGRRALVVGTGAIGREIAGLLRAVGLEVSGAGRTARADDPDFGTVHASADLAAVVGDVDYLVVVAPLTEATRNLVDAKVIGAMKPSARLIDVARGGIVDEQAVAEALRTGDLAGAAFDVFATEPLAPDDPLWTTPNVIVSPHMSGDTAGWLDDLAALFVTNFDRWTAGEQLLNPVDKRLGFAAGREGR